MHIVPCMYAEILASARSLCLSICRFGTCKESADQSYKVVLSFLLASGLALELDETIFSPQPFPLLWEKIRQG